MSPGRLPNQDSAPDHARNPATSSTIPPPISHGPSSLTIPPGCSYRQLEVEGFITIAPHKGPTVTVLTDDEARQVYEVREALECMAVRLFVERGSDAAIDRLRSAVDAVRKAHTSGEVAAMLEVKKDFYDALHAGSGNDILRDQAALLQSRLYRLRARSLSSAGRPDASVSRLRLASPPLSEGQPRGSTTSRDRPDLPTDGRSGSDRAGLDGPGRAVIATFAEDGPQQCERPGCIA